MIPKLSAVSRRFGYLRFQPMKDLTADIASLDEAGVSRIFSEAAPSRTDSFQRLLSHLGRGDVVVVPRLGSLAPAGRQLTVAIDQIEAHQARVESLNLALRGEGGLHLLHVIAHLEQARSGD